LGLDFGPLPFSKGCSALNWKNFSGRIWTRLNDYDLFGYAGQLSFYFLLALAPLTMQLLLMSVPLYAQQKVAATPAAGKKKPQKAGSARAKTKPAKPLDELARLREEYIKASNEYQELLKKQVPGLQRNVERAHDQLTKMTQLFAEGLISKQELEASERALAEARNKVSEINQEIANADSRIADLLLEAEAERKLARSKPIPRGGLVSTVAMIRYNGGASWGLSDAFKVQRFFLDAFKRPLPVAVFGQGAIHDRWRLDHRNAMDVSLHPDGPEGQALLGFLRANGIPFLAFRQAIPGTATGPHIHIGRPSHRY
jgi:hypothetical protein